MPLGHPVLQFGTSRFLQAHVDLFVSQALDAGQALGGITVVQTSGSAQGAARVAALAAGRGYPVRLQGLRHGQQIDELCDCHSVRAALSTATHWNEVRREMTEGAVQVVVSNTGDAGWQLADVDGAYLVAPGAAAPQAFPAKLLVLLHDRWQAQPDAALTLLPCELVSRNGDRLRDVVANLGFVARDAGHGDDDAEYGGDDADGGQRIGGLVQDGHGLRVHRKEIVELRLHRAGELIGLHFAVEKRTKGVLQKVDGVMVVEETRVLGEYRAGLRLQNVILKSDNSFFPRQN